MENVGDRLGSGVLIKAFVRNRRTLYVIIAVGILISLTLALVLPRKYTAVATILPSGQGGALGKLGSIVMAQSPALTSRIPENSSLLYPTVLSSRHILRKLAESRFELDGETRKLAEIIGAETPDEEVEKLHRIVNVSIDKKTQVIKVSATTGNPSLSASIVNRMLELLEEFNKDKNESRRKHTLGYLEKKLKEAKQQLYDAEKALMKFEKSHMDYATSTDPEVLMQHQKLSRELDLRETSYIEVLKEMELSKIELKRGAAVVRVLDKAVPPKLKSSPRRKLIVIAGGVITFLLSFSYCVFKEIPLAMIIQRFS